MNNLQVYQIFDHQNEKSQQTNNDLNNIVTSKNTICFQLSSIINVTIIKISFDQFWLWCCWTKIILNVIPNGCNQISDNCWQDWEDYEVYGASPFPVEYPEWFKKQTGELLKPSNDIHRLIRKKEMNELTIFCFETKTIFKQNHCFKNI